MTIDEIKIPPGQAGVEYLEKASAPSKAQLWEDKIAAAHAHAQTLPSHERRAEFRRLYIQAVEEDMDAEWTRLFGVRGAAEGRTGMLTDEEQEQLRKHEVSRGGDQRPTKPCEHDFVFLRAEDFINPDGVQNLGKHRGFKDVFYCRRCLEYREVKR